MGIIRSTFGSTNLPDSREGTVDQPETVEATTTEVSCDGGGGALGHPCVYLKIDARGWVECPYCDRRFVLSGTARTGS